ncbi:hypothetical protein BH10PSE18_BH10PSE18_26050 [soil metagenome]
MSVTAAPSDLPPDALTLVRALQALRRRSPQEPGYWDEFASGLRYLCRARRVWVCERDVSVKGGWRARGCASEAGEDIVSTLEPDAVRDIQMLAPRAADKGFALMPSTASGAISVFRLAVRLELATQPFALIEIPQRERTSLNELVLRAQLVADLPAESESESEAASFAFASPIVVLPSPSSSAAAAPPASAATAVRPLAMGDSMALVPATPGTSLPGLLALAQQVQREQRVGAALLTLVNGLAALTGAAQVALGWAEGGHVTAATISHLDRFDSATELVEFIEAALDETLAHEGALRSPAGVQPDPAPALSRLGDALGFPSLCALALRQGVEPATAAVLFAFDEGRMLPDADLGRVRSMLDLVLPRLAELRARERFWGLRLRDASRQHLAGWLGPRHVWLKALTVAAGIFIVYAAFAKWDYRVNGSGQLTTDSTRVLAANYDGRVENASATAGELVTQGQLLAELDTRELRQQQNDAQAELHRYTAEADKARAGAAWAEMEIATARQQQSEARLARVREMIEQASVRAPFDGVLVEGERKDLQGAPVKKGDKLFRVARIEGLYVVATVPESDIPLVPAQGVGEFVLVSDPDRRIPLKITAIIPVAQTKGQEGNQFMVRAQMQEPPQSWWRPGMSGAVRIDAGRRNVAWIITHRFIDKLRLMLWW